jgi:hypothetical protein
LRRENSLRNFGPGSSARQREKGQLPEFQVQQCFEVRQCPRGHAQVADRRVSTEHASKADLVEHATQAVRSIPERCRRQDVEQRDTDPRVDQCISDLPRRTFMGAVEHAASQYDPTRLHRAGHLSHGRIDVAPARRG